ncbi:LOW QUALITY PROTEIN: vacuolar sorting protein 35, putative [Eimeria necatrix]|uniref:Vacuolar protein sorting-associated protein 35 n=1 Tax=Eimeria necatrix TaxID=51315 RepID=U6N377_9EIME|nr:LOW QUALITY PROTEIN: vacuolar sorting protein 35, putative [Eimeria necatrix]CDJ68400.1 vacuolar sorting protein 35, putative [Eimeria necatrix]
MQEKEQEKLLEEASTVVREQGCYMKRAIDSDNLRDALKHASNFVSELRTSLLSPKHYYELYMLVFQELQHLLAFFSDKSRHGRRLADLYETVQHAGNIVPRLYLLVTVGVAFIKSKEAPAADILRDLTELCKGVQHPMRGLFLRFYLTQLCRNVLPDKGSEYEQEGGSGAEDAFLFLLTNFNESARLWVRLQQQSSVRDRAKRENERQDLRVLVGSALVRMAQLEGMTVEFYKTQALPAILQQIMACKDTLAQQYLLDCVVQVFSDECHLQTLDQLLAQTANVQKGVALKPVLVNLLRRLTSFLQADPEALPQDISVFDLFRNFIESQVDSAILTYSGGGGTPSDSPTGGSMDLPSLLALQVAFLNFCLTLFPSRIDYVSQILDSAHRLLAATSQRPSAAPLTAAAGIAGGRSPPSLAKLHSPGGVTLSPTGLDGSYAASASARTDTSNKHLKPLPEAGMEALMELLAAPLRVLSLQVLNIESYAPLMDFLDNSTRNSGDGEHYGFCGGGRRHSAVFCGISGSFPESGFSVVTGGSEKRLDDESAALEEPVAIATEAAQQLQQLAMLVHLAKAEDTDDHFSLLLVAKSKFSEGGPNCLRVLLPPLVISACRLLPSVIERQQRAEQRIQDVTPPAHGGKKICQFMHSTCLELVQIDAEMALRLWLVAAMAADNANVAVGGYEAICHEFISQALVCFEEEITESKRQFAALSEMVGCMSGFIRGLDRENYDSIASRVTQHGAKLLKKPDQCRAVLSCSHLYWNAAEYRDSRRVLECLQKCLKIADVCVQASTSHVSLFIEILDKYVYYFDQNNPEVTVDFIQNLVALCAEHCRFAELDKDCSVMNNFRNTLQHLRRKKQADGSGKYRDV